MPSRSRVRPGRTAATALHEVARILDLPAPPTDPAVTGVTHDSRHVEPGDLYAALPGATTHGALFAADARAAGAVAVLTDPPGAAMAPDDLPALVLPDPRGRLGDVAAHIYGHPASALLLLGVTGTNGKTTTAHLIEAGLRRGGHTTGLIGTVETRIGDERVGSVRTTPEATDVHALLATMRERGVTACVMEVSSHALVLGRVGGMVFDVAGFTNLSPEHLDFHGDLEDYYQAKATLFTPHRSRRAVVCIDDPFGRRLARDAGVPVVTVSTTDVSSADADWRIIGREVSASGGSTRADLEHRSGRRLSVSSPIPGDFNLANAVLAVTMLLETGASAEDTIRGVALSPGVAGRMERVRSTSQEDPLAVVDYAHTPDAIENVLLALRPSTPGRLVVVLGAGGDRDPRKRPFMGAAAARHADLTIVTDDNPRSEDPAAIRGAVVSGAVQLPPEERGEVREVGDRGVAIQVAVDATTGGQDTVIVVGKGHEQGQEVAGVMHPFDDRAALRLALEARADRVR